MIYPQITKYHLPQIVCTIYPPPQNRPILSKISNAQHHALLHKGLFCERPIKYCREQLKEENYQDHFVLTFSSVCTPDVRQRESVQRVHDKQIITQQYIITCWRVNKAKKQKQDLLVMKLVHFVQRWQSLYRITCCITSRSSYLTII